MLKVSPYKGEVRFGKRGKLNPRYVGPSKVMEKVGSVDYKLELPQELSRVHHTFHFGVSSWRGARVDVRTYLLDGTIDGSKANRIIHDSKQEVWNDCMSCKVRISSNGNLLWEVSVLLGRKKDDRGVTEGREDVREVFQQCRSRAKRKLSKCGRNQMGNEPILAFPEGPDDFVVYYDARSKDLEAGLEKREGDCWLTNRWLSMKKVIASCGSKCLAYLEVEVEYQGSSGLLLQPELRVVEGLTLERCSTFGKKDKLEPSYVGPFEIFGDNLTRPGYPYSVVTHFGAVTDWYQSQGHREPVTPAPTATTITVTEAQLQALINQGVAAAMAEAEASRVKNGYDINGSGPRPAQAARECSYSEFLKCKPLDFKGTDGVVGLTRWFEKMESVFSISNYTTSSQVKFVTCTLEDDALTW
ncbi:hypothetical protein Tco_0522541 [Tanacetum coccineum]